MAAGFVDIACNIALPWWVFGLAYTGHCFVEWGDVMKIRWVASGLGILTMWLWYMPWIMLGNDDQSGFYVYQSGQHIGGTAYLLLGLGAGYSYFTWKEVKGGRILVSLSGLLISLGYLSMAGKSAGWGLLGLCLVEGLSLGLALLKSGAQVTE